MNRGRNKAIRVADDQLSSLDDGFEELMLASEFFDEQAVNGYAALGKARGAVGCNEAGEPPSAPKRGGQGR